jgi:hypothetical protein
MRNEAAGVEFGQDTAVGKVARIGRPPIHDGGTVAQR